MIALLDTTVLSNFALVGRPELLQSALGETAATVEEVLAEYQMGVQLGRLPSFSWTWLQVLEMDEIEHAMSQRLQARLGRGEAACLALASVRGCRVLTDDRTAREMAMQMGIPVSGTLGLLVRLVDEDHLSFPEADDQLRAMIATGYRSPITSLTEIM
ncbi:MAG: DUF3368 domain-containing protein [Anaerolineae bacterium]